MPSTMPGGEEAVIEFAEGGGAKREMRRLQCAQLRVECWPITE